MKSRVRSSLCIAASCVLAILQSNAQNRTLLPKRFPGTVPTPNSSGQPLTNRTTIYTIPGKRASQYTAEDWGKVIDSTWGAGQSAVQQLNVFDSFWSLVDQQWAGFPNLSINWDSVRTLYRPQIGSGLSRGRFAALMSRVWMSLMEHHTCIYDMTVDQTYGTSNIGFWDYQAEVPLLVIGTYWWDLLGAPVTALPDSTGLVYRVAAGNPLGLQPGDIVLGYEGVPWKNLYPRLLGVGVPVNRSWSCLWSTPESYMQLAMSAVGWNWGMFDTMDVVKYATGDTVHLPTAPLATLTQNIWASDQVPVPGVSMPEGAVNNTNAVSWGVVQGTNIGYIYVWDWTTSSTPQRFADAVSDLRYTKKVTGLIIDLRMNWGGDATYADGGLSQLFNSDPTTHMSLATRNSSSDHLGFAINNAWRLTPAFVPTAQAFDRPIAVLIGPGCLSAGEYTAFWMRFHPMARSFGKPTNGGFINDGYGGTVPDAWPYYIPTSVAYSDIPGEGFLIHKGIQPDEKVWLTRDGVAKGADDVVQRALSWITTLSYAHDVHLVRHGVDTLGITAQVENPLAHALKVEVTLNNGSGRFVDSISLFDDGQHGDGAAGDGLWGYTYVPAKDDTLTLSIRTDDLSAGTSRTLPSVARYLFTRGPLIAVDVTTLYLSFVYNTQRDTSFYVKNIGYKSDSLTTSLNNINVIPDSAISVVPKAFALAPGDSQKVTFSVQSGVLVPAIYYTYIVVTSKFAFGQKTFTRGVMFEKLSGVTHAKGLPKEFALSQNYPNPFNPSTTITFELPRASQVNLSLFDILGRKVSELVNEKEQAGVYEVKFDGSDLASGVYLYRIQAGDFVRVKKMLFVK